MSLAGDSGAEIRDRDSGEIIVEDKVEGRPVESKLFSLLLARIVFLSH